MNVIFSKSETVRGIGKAGYYFFDKMEDNYKKNINLERRKWGIFISIYIRKTFKMEKRIFMRSPHVQKMNKALGS